MKSKHRHKALSTARPTLLPSDWGSRVEGGVGLVRDVEQPLAQHLRGHEKQASCSRYQTAQMDS